MANFPVEYLSFPVITGTPFRFSASMRASSAAYGGLRRIEYLSETTFILLVFSDLYPLLRIAWLMLFLERISETFSVTGVLPVPPHVRFPMLITKHGSFLVLSSFIL